LAEGSRENMRPASACNEKPGGSATSSERPDASSGKALSITFNR
jgi:hypothetical protein